jgi:hypothetical protein
LAAFFAAALIDGGLMSKRWIFSEASTLILQYFSSSRTRSASRETTYRTKAATDWPRMAEASLSRLAVLSGKRGFTRTTLPLLSLPADFMGKRYRHDESDQSENVTVLTPNV